MKNTLYYVSNIRLPTEKAHGIQIMKMCEAFADAGLMVALVVPKRQNTIKGDAFEYYEVKKNFRIVKLPCIDLIAYGKFGFWVSSFVFAEMASWFLLGKKGVCYVRDELLAVYLRSGGRKVIFEAHMGHINIFSRSVMKMNIPIVAISQGLKNFFTTRGVESDRVLVSHDGVDLKDFAVESSRDVVREKSSLPLDRFLVMYIGLFDEWKGYDTLLNAFELIQNTHIGLVMIGGRPDQVEVLRKQYPRVRFLGYRPYTELPNNQKAADLLVIPNSARSAISRDFTSPLKLFAHMTSGVPIAASDIPSLREILNDANAFFFKPDDMHDLARAIEYAVAHESEGKEKAKQATQDVTEYSWSKRAEGIIEFMNRKHI